MLKTIYLVRHCKYHNPRGIFPGRLPVSLSQEGRKQAVGLKRFFKDRGIQKIWSSAVLRCKQTSAIISNDLIPIEYDKRLLEVFSSYQGYWGLENNALASWDEFYSHAEELGGELYKDVQERMVSFFNFLLQQPEHTVLVCSHGDPLQILYYHLSGTPIPRELDELGELGNPLYQPKGSIRKLVVEDGLYRFDEIIPPEELSTQSHSIQE